jgi:uncharacterized membrane protein
MSEPQIPKAEDIQLFPPAPPPKAPSFGAGLRAWFLTGVIIAGPLAVTGWLVWWFIDTVDHWVKPLVPPTLWPDTYLPVRLPGTGVVLAVLGLTMLGFLAANIAGRGFLRLGELMLDRMPVVRGVYKAVKQVFETVFSQQSSSFRKVCLVQFPMPGMWSLAFISAPPAPVIGGSLPEASSDYISVFLPCTPNPTTGFWFYVPTADVVEVSLSPDEAFKLIMSAGVIQPGAHKQIAEMAEAALGEKAKTSV